MDRTTVDGVEVFWAEAPGPPTATLTFRVGVSDETLFVRGITHMVEHLALQSLALQTYSYNGFVDLLRTTFTATGELEKLSDFLRTVCRHVSKPPPQRFEHERQILLTESGRHDAGGAGASLAARYGPRGPGLAAYDEFGLHHLGAEAVHEWAQRYFRPENAVLWLTREPPHDLELPLEPGGSRHGVAETEPVHLALPGWQEQGDRGVLLTSLHGRSVGASALVQVLERRLQQELRYSRGISYEVGAGYLPLSARRAHSTIWTDVLKEKAGDARDVVVETLRALAEEGPTDDEVDQRKRDLEKAHADPLATPAKLDWMTQIYLLDPAEAERDLIGETNEMTPEDVRAAAEEFVANSLYTVPVGTGMPAGYERMPEYSLEEVRGRVHRPVGTIAGGDQRLVLGEEGITVVAGRGKRATIRFDGCEAMLRWERGPRILFGSDGFVIHVQPNVWRGGKRVVAALDERLADRAVAMKTDAPKDAAPTRPNHLIAAGIAAFFGIGAMANAISPEEDTQTPPAVFLVIALALLTFAGVSLWKHFRLKA